MTGFLVARGRNHVSDGGEQLGLGGRGPHEGRLLTSGAGDVATAGGTPIARWTWNNVALVRSGRNVRVYLNGALEIEHEAAPPVGGEIFVGGRADGVDGFEGRIDEVALWSRALGAAEIRRLAAAADVDEDAGP